MKDFSTVLVCVCGDRYQYAWNSVYSESIFESAQRLLQQFELETNECDASSSGVTVSSWLTLGDTAASAIVAVTLMAMGKVPAQFFYFKMK